MELSGNDLITLTKGEIPAYLRQGELYRTLIENNEDPNEEVTFPASVLRPDTNVANVGDCDHLLNNMRFWGVTTLSVELVTFVLLTPEGAADVLLKYEDQFPWLPQLCECIAEYANPANRMEYAIESSLVEVVKLLAEDKALLCNGACNLAVLTGCLDILQILVEHGCNWDTNTVYEAAQLGYVHMLKYFCKLGYHPTTADMTSAAMGGHINCISYMLVVDENLLSHSSIGMADAAIGHGHVHILHFLDNIDWTGYTCTYAARYGHLDCLQFLRDQGCDWGENTCALAAQGGHLDCLMYLHEQGCDWNADTFASAGYGGHLACIQYAHAQGCEWKESACISAAKNGNLECLQYLHEHGCPWDANVNIVAASYGHLDCLQYAHEHGCVSRHATEAAAQYGHLHCLKYLHEQGYEWDEDVCKVAIQNGHLECLQYAHENGCPMPIRAVKIDVENPCKEYLDVHFGKV